jgi:hypothetical protein
MHGEITHYEAHFPFDEPRIAPDEPRIANSCFQTVKPLFCEARFAPDEPRIANSGLPDGQTTLLRSSLRS